jgi:DNA-directed RNA polymerase subunit RPC12/RpoP
MAVFKCKMCGWSLDVSPEMTIGTCRYCGSVMTLPKLSSEKRANLNERANACRRAMGHPGVPKAYVHQFKTNTFENVFKGTPILEQEKDSRCMYCGWKLSFFKKCKNKHCDGKSKE